MINPENATTITIMNYYNRVYPLLHLTVHKVSQHSCFGEADMAPQAVIQADLLNLSNRKQTITSSN